MACRPAYERGRKFSLSKERQQHLPSNIFTRLRLRGATLERTVGDCEGFHHHQQPAYRAHPPEEGSLRVARVRRAVTAWLAHLGEPVIVRPSGLTNRNHKSKWTPTPLKQADLRGEAIFAPRPARSGDADG